MLAGRTDDFTFLAASNSITGGDRIFCFLWSLLKAIQVLKSVLFIIWALTRFENVHMKINEFPL
jgi:hypothetical protein